MTLKQCDDCGKRARLSDTVKSCLVCKGALSVIREDTPSHNPKRKAIKRGYEHYERRS